MTALTRFAMIVLMSLLTAGAGYLGFRVLKGEISAAVYRDRLSTLAKDYEGLRQRYNEAVRQSAVTELVVADGKLTVEVRSSEGLIEKISTPFDPSREIFVDYAVVGGRLLIRRVFDARTSPDEGLLIDSKLAAVDWNSPDAAHGKAVYRTLGEGRWVISVSGNGALTLTKSEFDEPAPLVASPAIKTAEEELTSIDAKLDEIGWSDVLKKVTGQ